MEASQGETSNTLLDLSHNLAKAVEQASQAVVAVNARPRVATSGVHWRQGVVVSTNHTVKRDEEITVMLGDGRTVAATLAGRDPSTDLAVLRIDGDAGAESATEKTVQHTAKIGDAAQLKVGSMVLAVGRTDERGASASFGIISAAGAAWRTWRGGQIDQLLRLDLAIYLGFSGGALVDIQGHILGINTSGLARGAGVAIPASTVNRVVDALLAKGRIARGYLGVGTQPVRLPDALQATLVPPTDTGLIVLSVESSGPAGRAGLLIGDIVFALDGAPLRDTDDVQKVLGPERIGQLVTASIIRGGASRELMITVGERPQKGR